MTLSMGLSVHKAIYDTVGESIHQGSKPQVNLHTKIYIMQNYMVGERMAAGGRKINKIRGKLNKKQRRRQFNI